MAASEHTCATKTRFEIGPPNAELQFLDRCGGKLEGQWEIRRSVRTDCGAAAPHLELGLWSSCSTLGSRGAVDGFMFSAKGSPERYAVASALHFNKV